MKVFFKCPSCDFHIDAAMRAAIRQGKCPSCGETISTQDIAQVFLLVDTIVELKLPLDPVEIKKFVDVFLGEKLACVFPDFFIQEELNDKARRAAAKAVYTERPSTNNGENKPNTAEHISDPSRYSDFVDLSTAEESELKKDFDSKQAKRSGPLAPPPDPKEFSRGSSEDRGISFLGLDDFAAETRGTSLSSKLSSLAEDINAAAREEAAKPKPSAKKTIL